MGVVRTMSSHTRAEVPAEVLVQAVSRVWAVALLGLAEALQGPAVEQQALVVWLGLVAWVVAWLGPGAPEALPAWAVWVASEAWVETRVLSASVQRSTATRCRTRPKKI